MYEAETKGIYIHVEPQYLENESTPSEDYFVWAYHIAIENRSGTVVQLLSRHWKITDARGRRHEVKGEGVVGEQPILQPGEAYRYSSGTPLSTPSGIMSGSYQMKSTKGDSFDVEIPAFSLDSPHIEEKPH